MLRAQIVEIGSKTVFTILTLCSHKDCAASSIFFLSNIETLHDENHFARLHFFNPFMPIRIIIVAFANGRIRTRDQQTIGLFMTAPLSLGRLLELDKPL